MWEDEWGRAGGSGERGVNFRLCCQRMHTVLSASPFFVPEPLLSSPHVLLIMCDGPARCWQLVFSDDGKPSKAVDVRIREAVRLSDQSRKSAVERPILRSPRGYEARWPAAVTRKCAESFWYRLLGAVTREWWLEAVDPEVQAASQPRASGSAGGDAGAAVSAAVDLPSQPVDRDALFKLLSMGRISVLQEYTISDVLGTGTFARVHKAVKKGYAPVALKIYRDKNNLVDALEEAIAYARVCPHRNILTMLDAFECGGCHLVRA